MYLHKRQNASQTWYLPSVIPALEKPRQEHYPELMTTTLMSGQPWLQSETMSQNSNGLIMVQACNPSVWEGKAGRAQEVPAQPGLP